MFNILIVEDNKNTARLMEVVLTQNGYSALHASNGEIALKMLDENVNDPDGFCLVIEGGAIDNACEGRNVKEGVAEYLAFDEVWGYCVNWAMNRGDTIVVACPDHDSGGFYDPANNAGAPVQGSKDYGSLDDLLTALHDGTVADQTTLDGHASGQHGQVAKTHQL